MRNKVFSLLLIVLFVAGATIFAKPQIYESQLEKRYLTTSNDIKISSIFDGTFLKDIETVLKDQFYNREILMKKYFDWKNLLTIGGGIEYLDTNVIEVDNEYLLNNILLYDEEKMINAANRGYNINEIDLKYPDIKTYVYLPTRYEEIMELPSDKLANAGYQYKEQFLMQLNPNITVSSLELHDLETHKDLFYKTDFHWNNKGGYQGYSDIINMIKQDFNIEGPKTILNEVCYPYEFDNGNIASEVGGVGFSDTICDYVLEGIGEYTLYINDELATLNKNKELYALYGNDSMYSDYDIYFGSNSYKRVFDFNQKDKPNVLVFNDSYFNVIQEWFASHFNKTVIIDMRANDGSFNLDYYINEYDIDLILVSQMYNNLYFNGNMFIPIK